MYDSRLFYIYEFNKVQCLIPPPSSSPSTGLAELSSISESHTCFRLHFTSLPNKTHHFSWHCTHYHLPKTDSPDPFNTVEVGLLACYSQTSNPQLFRLQTFQKLSFSLSQTIAAPFTPSEVDYVRLKMSLPDYLVYIIYLFHHWLLVRLIINS